MTHPLRYLAPLALVAALAVPALASAGTQTFTSSGSFTVPAGITLVHVLVVGGGGGGGSDRAGGGGAGGFIDTTYPVNPGDSIPVTVGNGGAPGIPYAIFIASDGNGTGFQGEDSSFGTLVAVGGGAGGGPDNYLTSGADLRLNGGSGGGAVADYPPVGTGTCGQGNDGGQGSGTVSNDIRLGGGGGGAGAPGGNGTASAAGDGGSGLTSSITGSSVAYAGGGGGGQLYCLGSNGSGGAGGGGAGSCSYDSYDPGYDGGSGVPNTGGGGGGGGGWGVGGSGGSGIVVVAWNTENSFGETGGTGGSPKSCSTLPQQCTKSQMFTSSGTFTVPSGATSLSVQVWGGGGGGGGYSSGGNGGQSSFNGVTAFGGKGGQGYFDGIQGGAGGTASGGDSNATGASGFVGVGPIQVSIKAPENGLISGNGGASPQGGSGGQGAWPPDPGDFGVSPGGGGGAAGGQTGSSLQPTGSWTQWGFGGGGGGGYATKTFLPSQLPSNVAVTVGSGGTGGSCHIDYQDPFLVVGYFLPNSPNIDGETCRTPAGGNGGSGEVLVTWADTSCNAAPSCTISFSPTTLPTGGSSMITWSSSGDFAYFYNNTAGYVAASGAVSVYSAGDYSGYLLAADKTTVLGYCPAILTGDNQCVPTTTTCNPNSGNITDNCGTTTVCQNGCSTTTNQCNACASGYTLENGQCVRTSCPDGYTLQNGACVQNQCPTGQVLDPVTGLCTSGQCTAGDFCQGNGLWHENADCTTSSQPQQCPYGCATGDHACSLPSAPLITAWSVTPSLVASGSTVSVNWTAQNAVSCAVTGSNGDGTGNNATGLWNTFSNTKTSSPIIAQTTFTITCNAFSGVIPASVTKSAVVNLIPAFQEK